MIELVETVEEVDGAGADNVGMILEDIGFSPLGSKSKDWGGVSLIITVLAEDANEFLLWASSITLKLSILPKLSSKALVAFIKDCILKGWEDCCWCRLPVSESVKKKKSEKILFLKKFKTILFG